MRTCSAARLAETRHAHGTSFDGMHDVQPLPEMKHLQRRAFSQPPVLHAVLHAQHLLGAAAGRAQRMNSSGSKAAAWDGDEGRAGDGRGCDRSVSTDPADDEEEEGDDGDDGEEELVGEEPVPGPEEGSGALVWREDSATAFPFPGSVIELSMETKKAGGADDIPVWDFLESKATLHSLSASALAARGTWAIALTVLTPSRSNSSQALSLRQIRVGFRHAHSPLSCFTMRSESPRIRRVS